ncbi:hypothetical protein C0J52_19483 [Blattella germanica]|nr:hypothetical protein C0J52_19483 [Blattella germanica]
MSADLKPQCVVDKQNKEKGKRKKKFKMFPKAQRPSTLQYIFNNRYTERSLHYFSSGTGVTKSTMRDVLKEPTPFWFPKGTEEVSYKVMCKVWKERERQEQASYDVRTRPNYKSRQMLDLLKRLYVPDDDEEQKEPTLLDIDPLYFKVVEGRPIKEKLDIRKYVETIKNTLRTKLRVGIFRDEALKLEEKYLLEQAQIDELRAQHKTYVDTFNAFLAEDHETSLNLLHIAQQEARKSKEKYIIVKELHQKLGSLTCAVYVLEEKWRHLKMFQAFLYMISPMFWRQKHDFIHRRFSADDSGGFSLSSRASELFSYRSSSLASTDSLDAIIGVFFTDITVGRKPELYFQNPQELNIIFENLEAESLNFLIQLEELVEPIGVIKKAFEDTTRLFEAEALYISEKLENLNEAIAWEEERAQLLGNKAKDLLNDVFKDLVVAESSLSLHVFVEDVYESCIAPNDSNLGLYDMMQAIELHLESLLLKLDYLPHSIVKITEHHTYKEDARIMKDAYDAEAKLKLMEKLRYKLAKSLAPAIKPSMCKRLVPRTEPPPPRKKPPVPEKPLTQEEKDFLAFFTDYCQHTDNVHDYFPLNVH